MGFLDEYIKNAQARAKDTTGRYLYDLEHSSDPAAWRTGGPPGPEELAKRQGEQASQDYAQNPPVTIDSEVAKVDLSPTHKQNILEAYKNQFGQLPGLDNSYDESGLKTAGERQLAGNAPEQMGPPAPNQARASAPSQGTASSPVSELMGKLNNLSQSDRPSIQDILSKLNGPNPELQAAIAQRDKMQNLSQLGKSANMILGGQTHTTPSNEVWNDMSKNAGQGITDIQNKSALLTQNLSQNEQARKLSDEQVKSDPNSQVSMASVQIAKKLMPDLTITTGKTSAADLEKINPMLATYTAHLLAMEGKKDTKNKDNILKYSKAMGEDLDPTRGRSGNQGKLQGVISDSKAIDALVANYSDLDKVPPAQYAEMVSSLDRLVSRGNPAIERFRHLMPANASLSAAGMMQWIKSEPQGAHQKAFIENILNTSKAERDVASKQIMDGQFKKANSTHHTLKELSPDDWYANLSQATGLSIDEVKNIESQPGYKGTPLGNALHQTKSPGHKAKAGDTINYQGKKYKVSADGNSLEPA